MKLKLEYLAGWGIHSVLFSDAVLWERGQPPGIDVREMGGCPGAAESASGMQGADSG